jgi:hypothetical protein
MVSAPEVSTVTLEVYQPLLPGVPAVTSNCAVGAVWSILMLSGAAFVVRPAALVHEPLTIVWVVSSVSETSAVQMTPLWSSCPDARTTTALVYHPLLPSVPETTES